MRRRGFSLIELIVAIVIISVAVSGVLLVFTVAITHSADPMQQEQAVAIAEGYLDEILARPLIDPNGDPTGESRATYDDVVDYDGLDDSPPRDQNGRPLPLAGYRVRVSVFALQDYGPAGATVPARRIDVRVTSGALVDTTITGYQF